MGGGRAVLDGTAGSRQRKRSAGGAGWQIKVEIDTAVAKAMYGDRDHKYTITAEVTDASRRTITGTRRCAGGAGSIQGVCMGETKGFYRVGENGACQFPGGTSYKPVAGKGPCKLLLVGYDNAGKPVETEVQRRDGRLEPRSKAFRHDDRFKAGRRGAISRCCNRLPMEKSRIEGGYFFAGARR